MTEQPFPSDAAIVSMIRRHMTLKQMAVECSVTVEALNWRIYRKNLREKAASRPLENGRKVVRELDRYKEGVRVGKMYVSLPRVTFIHGKYQGEMA